MSGAQDSSAAAGMAPTAAQQKVLDRIATQRERIRARRAARLQEAQAAAGAERAATSAGPLLARLVALARQHPAITAAVTALGVAAAGPRRAMRWSGVLLPLLLKLLR